MGYNEQWGSLASRFAEAGIVEGLVPYKSAAGVLSFTKGIVRLKIATGQMHVRSVNFQVGNLVANTEATLSVAAVADGVYHVYAHPVVDSDGFTNGVEIKLGGLITGAATVADALDAEDPSANNGTDIVRVPEANYDASAFKMAAQVPDQDFYKGRSIKLGTIRVDTGDLAEIDCTRAHRVR